MRRIWMLKASCLVAASLCGPAAFAQNPEAEAAAARAAAAAAAARGNAQVSPNDPLEKICRIGPRSRETDIQKMEPFKVFDNLYHVGPCYVSSWILTTPQGDIMFALHNGPVEGTLPISWLRGGELRSAILDLPNGWRRTDLSWRRSIRREKL